MSTGSRSGPATTEQKSGAAQHAAATQLTAAAHLQHQHVRVAVLVHHQHRVHGAAQPLARIPAAEEGRRR